MENNTSSLTEIFFGNLDKDLVSKSGEFNVSFWGSENYFKKLKEPINWEHGVLCIFQDNNDEFWWKISGEYKKIKSDNFEIIKKELSQVHEDFNVITDILELISLNEADLFDIKDEFESDDILIEGEDDCDHFDIELFDEIKLEENNSIWVLETTRYKDLKYKITNNDLHLEYDSVDDLKLYERYIFSVVLKTM
jgi:hypothetical protein